MTLPANSDPFSTHDSNASHAADVDVFVLARGVSVVTFPEINLIRDIGVLLAYDCQANHRVSNE